MADDTAIDADTGALLLFAPVSLLTMRATERGDSVSDDDRDRRRDMLREPGRRADAHVARYTWARRFVRPGDRVLDAGCGPGYGSRVLADGTLAESVLGLDVAAGALAYATEHYGQHRPRLSYAVRDVATIGTMPAASFDVIVSFGTLGQLVDLEQFLANCQRLLTPSGRLVCSVALAGPEGRVVDSTPLHRGAFTRARLEELCGRHFLQEHVCVQSSDDGIIQSADDSDRRDASTTTDEVMWMAVGMTSPFGALADPVLTRWQPQPSEAPPALIAFARDYEHPWLVRALVSIGLRTESPALLEHLATRTMDEASADSADHGAALCVRAYQQLSSPGGVTREALDAIDRYCDTPAANPHVPRWHVSLRYGQGLAALRVGDHERAARALTTCVEADPLVFSPLLATKTVSACWLLGWMAVQARDVSGAARRWRAGVHHAERALHRP
ncbi:MAG: class I SAM-dependent methyltransferase, partial [Acidobacteriota bacterium]|nr:class I SAM-dependent methyltransferase [Acidobacteriota bacterium]